MTWAHSDGAVAPNVEVYVDANMCRWLQKCRKFGLREAKVAPMAQGRGRLDVLAQLGAGLVDL